MTPSAFDQALSDFINGKENVQLDVLSDLSEDDVMDVSYYFRKQSELPKIEQKALKLCGGKVLDVGACVGAHSIPLSEEGYEVKAIEVSQTAVNYLESKGVSVVQTSFQEFQTDEKFDTILLLMNGIGLAGKLSRLTLFLEKCYHLLAPGGRVICDSTDVHYFYEDEDGAVWHDLNADYFGDFKFKMKYGSLEDDWFDWVYVDQETLTEYAIKCGFNVKLHFSDEQEHMFLMELKKR
jgi:SAM-dependent methyltransferase